MLVRQSSGPRPAESSGRQLIMALPKAADILRVILREALIRDAILRATPDDLDYVLAAVEAYRTCVSGATKLLGDKQLAAQWDDVMRCAEDCERVLVEYSITGMLRPR